MEAQTYLTQIAIEGENQSQLCHQKFTRFKLTQGKKVTDGSQTRIVKHPAKLFNKSVHAFLSDDYYTAKKVKPGIQFYKAILQGEERRKTEPSIPILRINMPQTLLFLEHSLQLLHTDDFGTVKIRSELNFNQFVKILRSKQSTTTDIENGTISQFDFKQLQTQGRNSPAYPAVLTGIGNGCYTDFSVYLSNQLDSRILPRNQNQMSIVFTAPFCETPNLLRLWYTPNSIRRGRPNNAKKAINKLKLTEQILERKHKQLHNYIVDFNKSEHILVNEVKGKALAEVQAMTQNLVEYLQAVKKVKITQIVIDYVFGEDRKYYFHEIKSIKSVNLTNIWDIGTPEQIAYVHKEQSNQVQCRLCQFMFPRIEMTKHVTNKLIFQLLTHLKQRGQSIFQQCPSSRSSASQSGLSNVCEMCYELIVAEHKLIDVEQQFCKIGHMFTDKVQRVRPIFREVQPSVEALLSGHKGHSGDLFQWRLFFYIERIKNVPIEDIEEEQNIVLNMKFNEDKSTFTKCYKKPYHMFGSSRAQSAYSAIRAHSAVPLSQSSSTAATGHHLRHDKKSTLHTNCTNRSHLTFMKQKSMSQVSFQKVKILPFFTETDDISDILNNQEITFELSYNGGVLANSYGVSRNKYKFKGQSSTLKNFSNKKECQRHSCEVLLFGEQYQYCNLELNVGIICDGRVNDLGGCIAKSQNGRMYLQRAKTGRSCAPLPPQWIQTVSQGLLLQQQDQPQLQAASKQIKRVQSGLSLTTTKSIRSRLHPLINPHINEQEQPEYL